jgi:hypothetical protein
MVSFQKRLQRFAIYLLFSPFVAVSSVIACGDDDDDDGGYYLAGSAGLGSAGFGGAGFGGTGGNAGFGGAGFGGTGGTGGFAGTGGSSGTGGFGGTGVSGMGIGGTGVSGMGVGGGLLANRPALSPSAPPIAPSTSAAGVALSNKRGGGTIPLSPVLAWVAYGRRDDAQLVTSWAVAPRRVGRRQPKRAPL